MRKILVILAAVLPLLAGCPSLPTTADLPDSKTLPAAANEALKILVVTKEGLDIAANFVADGVNQGLIEPTQGRTWAEQLKTCRARLAEAEKLYGAGSFDLARLQAEGQKALIKIIHDQAIEAVKRSSAKPASLVEVRWQIEVQPNARRLAWTR